MMVIPLRSRIDPVSSEPTAPCGDDLASTYRVSSESAPLFLVARAPLDHLLSAAHEQHFPWPQRAAFPLMADVPPRRADSRPTAANATAGPAAAATATPTAPTWDFLTVHTQRALKRRHSEQDECDERDKRDERDARRSTNGDDPSRLMSLTLANSSVHPARPCSSAHPARPRANDDGAVVAANPSLQPLPGLAGPVTPPAAFPPSHQPGAFSGLESHGHGLAPICATPASVSASHAVSLHPSPATFPPPLPALFTLRQASMPRGALLPLPELLLPGLPRGGPGIGSLSEALFRRLTGLTGLTGITGLTGLPRATGATGGSGGFSCALCGRTFPTVHALGGHKSMHRKGVHRAHTSATSTSSTRNGGSGNVSKNKGCGNVSKNKGCGSSSRGGAPSGGARPELPSPARFLKRCKVTAADVDDANAAADAAADAASNAVADAAADAASNAVADADANAAADAAADAADVDAAAQTSHATRGTDTAHQEPSERSATEGGNPAKASPLTPPVTPTNEETVPASWPKAGGALGAAETSVQADQIPRAAGTGRGETGTLAGDVGEQVVGESGGACEKHMRVQLKQAIKERLVQAHLLQARLLQARLSQPRQLQTRQALHHGGGKHTSCSGAGVAPWSPPALVLEAAQSTSCLQGRGAPASFSPAAIAACSPTALSTTSGATAGPVCASDLNLPPADVAGGVVSEAGGMDTEAVIMVNEDADLALAALAIECEAREAREAGDLPSSDECMDEADTRTAPNPGCTAQGDFPGTACLAGRDASAAGASGNALGIARDAVFLFACNLGAEKVFCANDVFAANSSKLDGADSRAGCLDLTLHL